MYGLKFIVFLLPLASLKAMASNQQRKKHRSCSGSWPSLSSVESWLMVGSPVAAEYPVTEEDPFSISAAAEEEPPAVSVAAVAEEDPDSESPAASAAAVAEADPYSEPFAAPAAPSAIEDATPVAAVAAATLRMQPWQHWRFPLQDGPFGAALAFEDAAPAAAPIAAPIAAPPAIAAATAAPAAAPIGSAAIDAAPIAAPAAIDAAAIDAAPAANDGQPGAQVFDLEYFRSYRPFTGACSQHNVALKYFRGEQERLDDPFQSPSLEFHASAPIAVAVIHHPKGMAWSFTGEWRQWCWHEMIAQLDDTSMEKVVNGFEGRSRGLVGCSLAIRPGSYYVKTATNSKRQLPYWDFVVHRNDGSGIRLDPQYEGNVVETIEEPGPGEEWAVTVPPRRGIARSDGPFASKKYKDSGIIEKMRFDASKKP